MKKSIYILYMSLIVLFFNQITPNGVELSDGKPMKLEVDGSGKEEVDFDIDGSQFQIPVIEKKPGVLDFLPEDIKKEEIEKDGGIEGAMELLGRPSHNRRQHTGGSARNSRQRRGAQGAVRGEHRNAT